MRVWIEYSFTYKHGTEKLETVFSDNEIYEYIHQDFKLDAALKILADDYIKQLYDDKAYVIGVHPA